MTKLDLTGLEKYSIYSNIEKASELPTEKAEFLGIPPEGSRQPDLSYFTSVFVSSGFNLNSAYFLPSELITAKNTISSKPLDIEHEESKIVGHLNSFAFAYKDGSFFDPDNLLSKVGTGVDKMSMDIVTASTVYKARFPEVVEKIEAGEYKVSMECYFRDFDIIVNDILIPKEEAQKLGLVEVINNTIKIVDIKRNLGEHRVGKVLRSMLFAGCGLVDNPANPESVILETATRNNNFILDLNKVDSYMKSKQEKEAITIYSSKPDKKAAIKVGNKEVSAAYGGPHSHSFDIDAAETFMGGNHYHMVMSDSMPKNYSIYFNSDGAHRHSISNGKIGSDVSHKHVVFIDGMKGDEVISYAIETSESAPSHKHDIESISNKPSIPNNDEIISRGDVCCPEDIGTNGGTSYGGAHYHSVTLKDGTVLKTVMPTDIIKMKKKNKDDVVSDVMDAEANKEAAGTGNVDGNPLSTPEMCVNFKRFIYTPSVDNPGVPSNVDKTPGLVPQIESLPIPATAGGGDNPGPDAVLLHENWCSLFDAGCPVPGGCAVHPDCFRLVLDRTTTETVTNYYEKLQENRKKAGITKVVSSLKKVIEEASKK
jgi:hypothetical protein